MYILLISALNFANPLYMNPGEIDQSTTETLPDDDDLTEL